MTLSLLAFTLLVFSDSLCVCVCVPLRIFLGVYLCFSLSLFLSFSCSLSHTSLHRPRNVVRRALDRTKSQSLGFPSTRLCTTSVTLEVTAALLASVSSPAKPVGWTSSSLCGGQFCLLFLVAQPIPFSKASPLCSPELTLKLGLQHPLDPQWEGACDTVSQQAPEGLLTPSPPYTSG